MTGITDFPIFLLTALTLSMIPGPDTLYIVARSTAQGRRAGIVSVLGISTGSTCHATAAALGLSAILVTSALAFTVVKWVGAAYLVVMGLRLLWRRERSGERSPIPPASLAKVYRQGMLTNLLNPKIALFYLALLPQFVDSGAPHHALALLMLGGIFITISTLWCLLVAIFAAAVFAAIRGASRVQGVLQRLSGALFVTLGVKLALEKSA